MMKTLLAALIAATALGAAAPAAMAQPGYWHHGWRHGYWHHGWRHRYWGRHHWCRWHPYRCGW